MTSFPEQPGARVWAEGRARWTSEVGRWKAERPLIDNGFFDALGIKSKVLTTVPADLYGHTGLFLVLATGPLHVLLLLPPLQPHYSLYRVSSCCTPEVECPFLWDNFPHYTFIYRYDYLIHKKHN